MVQREVYFVLDGRLFKKTMETPWDMDSSAVNKTLCSEEIFKSVPSWLYPCVDVATGNGIRVFKSLNEFNVKDSNGESVHSLWSVINNSKDVEFLPPGSHELIYLSNLTDDQIFAALSIKSFYDIYYNSKKRVYSVATALCALQMLYLQNKLDYIEDMYKFLHWYYINMNPVEYNDVYGAKWN